MFFVLVGSSGSDLGAIHEKLDFARKLGEREATAQTQSLSLPSDWGGFQYTYKVPRCGADKHFRNADRIRLDKQETARAAGSDIHVLIFHRCSYRSAGNRQLRAPQNLGARDQPSPHRQERVLGMQKEGVLGMQIPVQCWLQAGQPWRSELSSLVQLQEQHQALP